MTLQNEKPELEVRKTELLKQEEDLKIQLAKLEESLLEVSTHGLFSNSLVAAADDSIVTHFFGVVVTIIILSCDFYNSKSLVGAPGMHFLLTFVVHPAWTLLRSVLRHICFLLLTASPLTSLGHGRGWVIVHSRSLVCAPGTHFRLTFVVHSAWILLRSVSNHICFLLLMIYNNFFYLSNCLLLCILCTVIICTVPATSLCKHFLY